MAVIMKTIINKSHVRYLVFDGEDTQVFNEVVLFGKDKAHRAGGVAFMEAAARQQALADKLANAEA